MRFGILAVLFLVPSLGSAATLARNGRAIMPVVVSTNASHWSRDAAAELTNYLDQITGASFVITNGDEKTTGIVVGNLAEFPGLASDAWVIKSLVVTNRFDGLESYVIKNRGDTGLWLIGRTNIAVSHAVTRLLEDLGCRWFTPAPEWEVVPAIKSLRYTAKNIVDRPGILARQFTAEGFGNAPGQIEPASPNDTMSIMYRAWANWCRHSRLDNASFQCRIVQMWGDIPATYPAEFAAHPEYYAWETTNAALPYPNNGLRRGPQIEAVNAGLQAVAIRYTTNWFAQNPDQMMAAMVPTDGPHGPSDSPEARAVGSDSEQVAILANAVAAAVWAMDSNKWVGIGAWYQYTEPPVRALSNNVFALLIDNTPSGNPLTGRYYSNKMLDQWQKKTKHLGWFTLAGGNNGGSDQMGALASDTLYMPYWITNLVAHGVTMTFLHETAANFGANVRAYYLTTKLLWQPGTPDPAWSVNPQVCLDDFHQKAFGPAAKVMKQYYERLDAKGQGWLLTEDAMAQSYRDVNQAAALAANDRKITARLDHVKQYLHYRYLWWRYNQEAAGSAARKDWAWKILTHSYRIRKSFILSCSMNAYGQSDNFAAEFKDPTMSYLNPQAPYYACVTQSLTHAETETAFQEGLSYFRPQPVTQVDFSSELVPVTDFGLQAPKGFMRYGAGRVALHSATGEALQVTYAAGVSGAGLKDHFPPRPTAYTLQDARGVTVANAEVPVVDGHWHPWTLPVPHPGTYYVSVDDVGAGWCMAPTTHTPSLCIMLQKSLLSMAYISTYYFYVPKGTARIEYYWDGTVPHQVCYPDGKVAMTVSNAQELITVPVPKGRDGRVWSLAGMSVKKLWFYNLPNHVAMEPGALLVPRDIATRDGLHLR